MSETRRKSEVVSPFPEGIIGFTDKRVANPFQSITTDKSYDLAKLCHLG